jgi:hypothetical protein
MMSLFISMIILFVRMINKIYDFRLLGFSYYIFIIMKLVANIIIEIGSNLCQLHQLRFL